jgi:hypothetical protein
VCRLATIPYKQQMTAIEKNGEIPIAAAGDSIMPVAKCPLQSF